VKHGTLLGSSPTLAGIGEVVKAFYAGESKAIHPTEKPGVWAVHRADGTRIDSVIVRLHKGRYRLETA